MSGILILKYVMTERIDQPVILLIPVRPTFARGRVRGMINLYPICSERLKLIL